ncbi:alpha/beta hydrolase [Psychrobacter sanguinis]|uniref:alpha/beta fold hydrolase n=1 Tax=Psychrobacter sanguinis TaxID=861445 RepID=UPI002A760344|nr:alpha/beta hydrolase [Psychrobacter sanguinis]MDY3306083.1 alpha/beta hydrolase [Psychrobacter sanguinis]
MIKSLKLKPINPLIKASDLLQSYTPRLQQVISYDGMAIPVTVVGNPQAQPVLMLHAFGMDARQFLPFVLPLVGQFCFYLPHFRGFGLAAETPTSEFDFIEQYAKDVDQLLTHICDTHQVASVDVAGISMGALVAWAHFNRYADSPQHSKVSRYLNIDQSPTVQNQSDWRGGVFGEKQTEVFDQFHHVLQATLPYLPQQDLKEQQTFEFAQLPFKVKKQIVELETVFSLMSVQRLPSKLLINSSGYKPARVLETYQHPTWQQKLRGLQAYLELPYDYRQALNSIQSPVTMLVGSQSQLYNPKWQYKVAEALPEANVVEIAKSGHAIPLDAPLQFSRALKQFLLAS